jgi:NDP-sugar pyrophosphorylase family protein
MANAGYYILDLKHIFEMIPNKKIKMENSVFPKLASNAKLAGYIAKPSYWIDIGTLESYEKANTMAYNGLIISP